MVPGGARPGPGGVAHLPAGPARLASPRATGARFAPRALPAEDAAAFVRAALGARGAATEVEVLVHAPAEEVRRRIGQWSAVEPVDGGGCRVRMQTDDLAWPAFALGMTGAECTVVSPPELRDLLGEWAQRFGRAAAGPGA
ncbi:WYL domain-containing protein [Blastococcus saxobsidens]|uniref:WYL domain-containing protein n=1 Tax=Blastococcus saxobsidens TaxID=138336 RepID=UPI0031F2D9C6